MPVNLRAASSSTGDKAASVSPPAFGYLVAVVALTAMVAITFWPSYYGRLWVGGMSQHSLIHFHAAVFGGFVLVLIVQAGLVATGKTAFHRRFGPYAALYGGLVLLVGVSVGVGAPVLHVRAGEWLLDNAAVSALFSLSPTWCCLEASSPRPSCGAPDPRYTGR